MRHRALIVATALGLFLLVLAGHSGAPLAAIGSSDSAARVTEVRAGLHDGYARLALQWDSLPEFDAKVEGSQVVIHFAQPILADFDWALARLEGRVTRLEFSADRHVMRLELLSPVELRTFSYDQVAVFDLVEPGADLSKKAKKQSSQAKTAAKPKQAADTETARAPAKGAETEPAKRAAPKTPPSHLTVETREYGTFSRLIFEWPKPVDYDVENDGSKIEVRFNDLGEIDLETVKSRLPRRFVNFTADTEGDGTVVRVAVVDGTRLRHFQKGTRIVLDVLDSGDAAAPGRPDWATQGGPQTAAAEIDEPTPADPIPLVPDATQAELEQHLQALAREEDGGPSRHETMALPAQAELTTQRRAPALTGPPLHVSAEAIPDGVRLRLHWDHQVGAAVFTRAGYLWAIFDEARVVDLDRLTMSGAMTKLLRSVDQIPVDGATALRLGMSGSLSPRAARSGSSWIVEMTTIPKTPAEPLSIHAEVHAKGGARVLIPSSGSMQTVELEDPEVGDSLIVVPLDEPGLGVKQERRFAQFGVLPSAQGAVVWPQSDSILVKTGPTGIEISSDDELFISDDTLAEREGSQDPTEGTSLKRKPLFGYASWRRKDLGNFIQAKHRLQNEVVSAEGELRSNRRLDLARFYFAHGFAADAIGILQRIAAEDESAETRPEFVSLRGATMMLLGRIDGAMSDLYAPILDGDMDITLWRAALAASRGDWERADAAFAISGPSFERLPPTLRARFGLLAAHAAISVNNLNRAHRLLERIEAEAPSSAARYEATFLQAKAHQIAGKFEAALSLYKTLEKKAQRPVQARATLARVDLMLNLGRITREEAIEKLEALRHVWRGDSFEQELLQRLGDLYQEERDYMNALSALRDANDVLPGDATKAAMKDEMQQMFAALFVEGGADQLTPLAALGLYYEFGELAPKGEEGSHIVEGLANRLVDIELLDRAEALLARQVETVEGISQARTGARLAVVQLLDRRPEEALETLDRTANADETLPKPLKQQRLQLQARALSTLGRHDQALALLSDDDTPVGEQLRADILWRAEKWGEAAAAMDKIFLTLDPKANGFEDKDRDLVMRQAIALAMASDHAGLGRLRVQFRELMADTQYADAFDLLTDPSEPEEVSIYDLPSQLANVEGFEALLASYKALAAASVN